MATVADSRSAPDGQVHHPGGGVAAALHAIQHNTMRLDLPVLGQVALPSPDRLAFYAGLAAIATAGLIDWPVAAVLAVGHLLADDHHHRLLRDFGQALEAA